VRRLAVIVAAAALVSCGRGSETRTVHVDGSGDVRLKKAEAGAATVGSRYRADAGAGLRRRADEIEATAVLRRKLGKSSALSEGERQILAAAADDRGRKAADRDPSLALRTRLGARHEGSVEVMR